MSEYYAVIRSGDHLAHYGVKGMRWGVRKAIERGNDRALSRQYKKAQKKLEKLNKKADVQHQSKLAKRYSKISGAGLAVGAAGIGGTIGSALQMKKHLSNSRDLEAAHKQLGKELEAADKRTRRDLDRRFQLTAQNGVYNSYYQPYQREMAFDRLQSDAEKEFGRNIDTYNTKSAALKSELDRESQGFKKADIARKASSIAGGIGLVGAAISGGKALQAKRRTTAEGHAKAVAERDAWKREMDKAFKGTKYASGKHRRK